MLTQQRSYNNIRPLLRQQRSYNNIGSTVAPDAARAKALQRYGRNLEVQALVVDAQIFRRKGGAPLQASALAFDSSRKVRWRPAGREQGDAHEGCEGGTARAGPRTPSGSPGSCGNAWIKQGARRMSW